MRFVCESCRAQYMINDEKVGPKGVKVRCRKCGYVILVKRGGDAQPRGPVASAGADPDDALATQVLQTPLTSPAPKAPVGADTLADLTNPGVPDEKVPQGHGPDSLLGDAGDDEIGAVFDQVLNSGAHSISQDALGKGDDKPTQVHAAVNGDAFGGNDDRMSTRVIDGDVVRKLAEEMGESTAPAKSEKNGHHAETEVPQTDWFAAIDEKQTGPLTLEKMKEHWDRGELGPDSLCWRAGFTDWVPLSDVAQLASVLAPRPASKPIVMNAPAGGPSVVSVPVESAFSAGGMMKSVRSEVQVPLGAPGAIEETGSWRPSAANSLTSLLKEEKEAQARPPPKVVDDGPAEVSINGLLDLPSAEEKPHSNGHSNGHAGASVDLGQREAPTRPARPAPAPANPYVATPGATYSSPGVTQYRPASNRSLLIGIGVGGGVIVLMLFGLVIWLLGKQQGGAEVRPPAVVAQNNPVVPPPVVLAPQPTQTPVVAPPVQPGQPPVVAQPSPPVPPRPGQPLPPHAAQQPRPQQPHVASAQPEKQAAPEKEKPEPKTVARNEPKGAEDDDFNKEFGDPKATKNTPKSAESGTKNKPTVYIPPAPGEASNNVKDTLGQSDIFEVVSANKPALAKCVEEQRKKEPGVNGKLVMKWSITTAGKVTNVSVKSEEFKSTYIAGCMGGLIKSWTFPKSKTAPEPIEFPFKF